MSVAGVVPDVFSVYGLPDCGEDRPLLRLPYFCQRAGQLQRNYEVPRSHHLQSERFQVRIILMKLFFDTIQDRNEITSRHPGVIFRKK